MDKINTFGIMIKRTLAAAILFSMVLHCASRLGFISYLYDNRDRIAASIGLVSETPIASCSSDYDFDGKLQVEHADSDKSIPASFRVASEIHLFIQPTFSFSADQDGIPSEASSGYRIPVYASPHLDIFQPPRV